MFENFSLRGFLPAWFKSNRWSNPNSYLLGQKGAIWLNVEQPYKLYNEIPQLKAVIDRKASMFANMQIKLIDNATGAEIDNPVLRALLATPNPMQSGNDWLANYKQQEQVYGNQFIYRNKVSALQEYPAALWNVSPRYMRPILSGKIFDQLKVADIITGYEYDQNGEIKKNFDPNDVLFSRLCDLDNPIVGVSPVLSLRYPLTNTKLSYEYLNVISGEKGAIGILSNQSKDTNGSLPLKADEKKMLHDTYVNKYGISEGQMRVIITEADMKWTAMTYPTKDLLLLEQIDAYLLTIIDHFGLNVNIFSNKNATFENVKQGILLCYQDTIEPEADKFIGALARFIGVPPTQTLIASYEHLSIMKENKQKGLSAVQALVASLTQAVQGGLIDAAYAKLILENELKVQVSVE